MITVACVWMDGKRNYGVEYVERLRNMVYRHLAEAHDFVCLTDRPAKLPAGVGAIPVKRDHRIRAWWHKLSLFDPDMPFPGDRVLYLDLDLLITGPLDAIARFDAPFAIAPDTNPNWKPSGGPWKVHKGFNSSVMTFDRGVHPELFVKWRPHWAGSLWGDQDYIKMRLPDTPTLPLDWFRRLSWGPPPWPDDVKVVLCGKPKNHEAAERWPWVGDIWR